VAGLEALKERALLKGGRQPGSCGDRREKEPKRAQSEAQVTYVCLSLALGRKLNFVIGTGDR
jgi:hypothetical protein